MTSSSKPCTMKLHKIISICLLALGSLACNAQRITNSSYNTIGYIKSDGTIQDGSYRTVGYIKSDGTVQNSSYNTIGYIRSNGTVQNSSLSFGTGEMMAVIEAKTEDVPHLEELCAYMDEGSGYNLESIFINEELVAGKSVIRDEAEGLNFEISRDSFYQVNPVQTAKLYSKAVEYAGVEEGQTVLDLYCGVGTIGLFAAKTIGNDGLVLGIETVKQAVLDANRNSVINGIVCTRYIQGKAEEELPPVLGLRSKMGYDGENRLVEKEPVIRIDHADVAFLDPPRAGCDEKLLDAVVEAGPDRIVYVSCDPATLARDVKYLGERGYVFVEAQPVDMFCHTAHCEVVNLLIRR